MAFAIVAQTGNMQRPLVSIIIASVGGVGTLFIRETKDVDIYGNDDQQLPSFGASAHL